LVPLFFQAGSDKMGSFSGCLGGCGLEAGAKIERAFAGVGDGLNKGVADQRDFFR
jgi:hypothetical protein